eukprot:7090157-Alexandrium_andersonii.AAC.1
MTPPGQGRQVCRPGTARRPPAGSAHCYSTTRRSRASLPGRAPSRAGPGGPDRRRAPRRARTPQ